jgi:hypothetical protein
MEAYREQAEQGMYIFTLYVGVFCLECMSRNGKDDDMSVLNM